MCVRGGGVGGNNYLHLMSVFRHPASSPAHHVWSLHLHHSSSASSSLMQLFVPQTEDHHYHMQRRRRTVHPLSSKHQQFKKTNSIDERSASTTQWMATRTLTTHPF